MLKITCGAFTIEGKDEDELLFGVKVCLLACKAINESGVTIDLGNNKPEKKQVKKPARKSTKKVIQAVVAPARSTKSKGQLSMISDQKLVGAMTFLKWLIKHAGKIVAFSEYAKHLGQSSQVVATHARSLNDVIVSLGYDTSMVYEKKKSTLSSLNDEGGALVYYNCHHTSADSTTMKVYNYLSNVI